MNKLLTIEQALLVLNEELQGYYITFENNYFNINFYSQDTECDYMIRFNRSHMTIQASENLNNVYYDNLYSFDWHTFDVLMQPVYPVLLKFFNTYDIERGFEADKLYK